MIRLIKNVYTDYGITIGEGITVGPGLKGDCMNCLSEPGFRGFKGLLRFLYRRNKI